MKKAKFLLIWVLFALTFLYPAGACISTVLGYRFELSSISGFVGAIAALSLCIVILDIVNRGAPQSKAVQILLAVMPPLSLVSTVFFILQCPKIWVIICTLFCTGCWAYLAIRYGKPLALKWVALGQCAVLILPICFFSFIALLFGNIGQNTVVQTVHSPSGKYYAQVIDSDQGALGGDTFVDVYEESGIHTILFKTQKKPQRVYIGEWGEFNNMQIYWKDDHCLVINGTEHKTE